MRTRSITLVLPALAVTLSLVLVTHGGAPAEQAKDVMQGELKYLETELAKPKVLKKAERKVRASAVVLAAAAKAAKKDGVADGALKVSKLMEDGNVAEARKIVADLAAGKDPKVKAPGSYKDVLEFELLMRQYSSEKVGGFGLERALEDLVDQKGPLDGEEAQKAAYLAAKIALIAEISKGYFPLEMESGEQTKKAWNAFNDATIEAANELAASVAKKGEVGKLADKLSLSCVNCHDVFR